MTRMTLITGAERRRQWSFDQRQEIVAAASAPGAVVAEVERRWDICTRLIYKWLREERRAACETGFTPVIVRGDPPAAAADRESAMITVEIGGARLRIGTNASAALVMAILKALRS
jgi:transposase